MFLCDKFSRWSVALLLIIASFCLEGYQLFADAEDMPAAYQHLRVRLRIEQTRLLNWGKKMGLIEELLDEPSRALKQNRNLIIDILLEIHALFRSCVSIQAKYDHLVPQKATEKEEPARGRDPFEKRFPKGTDSMLRKTLRFLEKTPEAPKRLQWAMVKREQFEKLVGKLIDYNTSIEALLDSTAVDQLQQMQQQTFMALLQLNSNVAELKEISLAVQVKATSSEDQTKPQSLVDPLKPQNGNVDIARLADFKARQLELETKPSDAILEPVERSDVTFDISSGPRSEAIYKEKHVWIEWKDYDVDPHPNSKWNRMLEDRIKKLALLLGSDNKPPQFNAPQCLGYFHDDASERYGFIYNKPQTAQPNTSLTSLLHVIQSTRQRPPSLTNRIHLAHTIARCLMYLHSVNWLHKGLRSNNVIFFVAPDTAPHYAQPLIAGFEYARPDFPDEETEPPPEHSEHDIYRHPAIIKHTMSRSQKSHDIYSLGIVLVEIAHWKSIDEVMDIPRDSKTARSRIRDVRNKLLTGDYLELIAAAMGEVYAEAVRKCLAGGLELGVGEGSDQSRREVGLRIQEAFAEHVVRQLGHIRI